MFTVRGPGKQAVNGQVCRPQAPRTSGFWWRSASGRHHGRPDRAERDRGSCGGLNRDPEKLCRHPKFFPVYLVPSPSCYKPARAWSSLSTAPALQGNLFSLALLPLGSQNWLPSLAPGCGAPNSYQLLHPWLLPSLLPVTLWGAPHRTRCNLPL